MPPREQGPSVSGELAKDQQSRGASSALHTNAAEAQVGFLPGQKTATVVPVDDALALEHKNGRGGVDTALQEELKQPEQLSYLQQAFPVASGSSSRIFGRLDDHFPLVENFPIMQQEESTSPAALLARRPHHSRRPSPRALTTVSTSLALGDYFSTVTHHFYDIFIYTNRQLILTGSAAATFASVQAEYVVGLLVAIASSRVLVASALSLLGGLAEALLNQKALFPLSQHGGWILILTLCEALPVYAALLALLQ